jgi:hypothetical protein
MESEKYSESLSLAVAVFLNHPGVPNLIHAGAFHHLIRACNYPWNLVDNQYYDFEALERLFRLRRQGQRCEVDGCLGNAVNILLSCNHGSCFACVDVVNQPGLFPDVPRCPRTTCLQYGNFVVPSNKVLAVLYRVENNS